MASSPLFSLPPGAAAALSALLGLALSGELTWTQQNTLGNLLMLVGQTLETVAAQGQEQQASSSGDSRLDALEQRLGAVERTLEGIGSQA